jgi:hypothetical protein
MALRSESSFFLILQGKKGKAISPAIQLGREKSVMACNASPAQGQTAGFSILFYFSLSEFYWHKSKQKERKKRNPILSFERPIM